MTEHYAIQQKRLITELEEKVEALEAQAAENLERIEELEEELEGTVSISPVRAPTLELLSRLMKRDKSSVVNAVLARLEWEIRATSPRGVSLWISQFCDGPER